MYSHAHNRTPSLSAAQSEVYQDPSSVRPPQHPYQDTPQVFLFSRPATKREDLYEATALAWRLRGLALVLLVHRYKAQVHVDQILLLDMLWCHTALCSPFFHVVAFFYRAFVHIPSRPL